MRIRPVLTVLAIVMATAMGMAPSAFAGGGSSPIGSVDIIAPDGKYDLTYVYGWLIDPDFTTGTNNVALYVDGQGIAWFPTGQPRPDVQAANPAYGPDNGFAAAFPNPGRGTHQLCAYGINRGPGGNVLLSCTAFTVTTASDLVGNIDSITSTGPDTYVAQGWVLDYKDAVSPTPFWLIRPGNEFTLFGAVSGSAGLPRPDVDAVYPDNGTHHGFSLAFTLDHSTDAGEGPVTALCLGNPVTGTTWWRITGFCAPLPS